MYDRYVFCGLTRFTKTHNLTKRLRRLEAWERGWQQQYGKSTGLENFGQKRSQAWPRPPKHREKLERTNQMDWWKGTGPPKKYHREKILILGKKEPMVKRRLKQWNLKLKIHPWWPSRETKGLRGQPKRPNFIQNEGGTQSRFVGFNRQVLASYFHSGCSTIDHCYKVSQWKSGFICPTTQTEVASNPFGKPLSLMKPLETWDKARGFSVMQKSF